MRLNNSRVNALKQIDRALVIYAEARAGSQYGDLSDLKEGRSLEVSAIMSATLIRLAPRCSPYLRYVDSGPSYMLGSLKALRRDYADDVLTSFEGLVRAELFSDFLEMAAHLLAEGYKDPAAVLIGSVLEGHLRALCFCDEIPTEINGKAVKAEALNVALAKAQAYNLLDQKNVTAWLDLRNKAAHGHYGEYTKEHVANQLFGVREFVARVSAPSAPV